jgi:gas vesicle protein
MSTGKILVSALAGAAAGATLGILFAPDKGSATRKKIMDMADDYGEVIKEKITDSIKTIRENFQNAAEDAKNLVEAGRSEAVDDYNSFKNADHHVDFTQS